MSKIRLDVVVHAKTPALSRASIQKLIKDGKVKVNGEVNKKTSSKIIDSDRILIDYKETKVPKIKLKIIYEDKDCVVVEKPVGLLTHSKGSFNPEPTVATWLRDHVGYENDSEREGIVHRLDRATSGVMICAKNADSLGFLQKQFSKRKVKKIYHAIIVNGIEPAEALIDIPIERNPKSPQRFRPSPKGKPAQTFYKLLKNFDYKNINFSLLELSPKTGRTHQLRVHLAYLKRPIVGDTFYNGVSASRLYLHAKSIEITLPNGERKTFISHLPKSFKKPELI